MSESFPYPHDLPPEAAGALAIIAKLRGAGHVALLAGGCVRDLLLGGTPHDYDVATDALPAQVTALFSRTRHVGVQFGVALVKQRGRWIEVATFRSDGPYHDGRRPASVTPTDARHDALRRDFTVNGMFLDPLARQVVDYVEGRADLAARLIRAIGVPAARFSEDYLRLLRAVRFAARLDFALEPVTRAAIQAHAPRLAHVAAERVREELEKMLGHATRATAWRLLAECELLPYLWPRAQWTGPEIADIGTLLDRLPARSPCEVALAIIVANARPRQIEDFARALTLSNEQRETVAWLIEHQADLDDPRRPSRAALKRLMAAGAFDLLCMLATARYGGHRDGSARAADLAARLAAIDPATVQPSPLVTGADLLARGVPQGPLYGAILDELYTRQLEEELNTRDAALAALDTALANAPAARAQRPRRGQPGEAP